MQKKFPEVSVIIPNWNGKHLLKKCFDSLKKQSYKDFETLVIDNGSIDGSLEFIKKNYPEINLIELETNIGFAGAVNLGIKICTGNYIVLLNNDTEADKKLPEEFCKSCKREKRGWYDCCKNSSDG